MYDCVFDIEADNLLYDATNIWCIVGHINNTYYIYYEQDESIRVPTNSMVYNNIYKYVEEVLKPNRLVGHSIVSYDLPLVNKLVGFEYEIDPDKIVDTHILSRLYNPDREGHGLEWWGNKFRLPKGDHKDWSCFSQEMLDYCIRDVDITKRLYYHLQDEGKDWDWSEAIKLEYNIWDIQSRQEQRGVAFDAAKAEDVLDKIVKEIEEIEVVVIPQIPLKPKNEGELKKIFLKSGEYTEPVKQWMENV